jgi:polysaccharide transporter, PST family
MIVFSISSLAKIIAIKLQLSLISFVFIYLLEIGLNSFGLIIVYKFQGFNLLGWKCKISYIKKLCKDSFPLMLSSFTAIIYMKIDQVMLAHMSSSYAVGVYSAAIRLSEVWYFIPGAITASVFPSIIQMKQLDEKTYYRRISHLFNFLTYLSVTIAIPITFLSQQIIKMLYGDVYSGAGIVLCVHIWSAIFVFLGVAQSPWNLSEGLQKLSLSRSILGAGINVSLNLLLIPQYGALGAAIATLVSYAVANYFANLFDRRTLNIFRLQSRALAFADLWNIFKH